MRILSVNHTSDVYGASRCLERLAERLIHGGHEVRVVVPSDGPLKAALEAHGVTVLVHPRLSIVDRNTTRTWGRRLRLLATFPVSVAWLALAILRFVRTWSTPTAGWPFHRRSPPSCSGGRTSGTCASSSWSSHSCGRATSA